MKILYALVILFAGSALALAQSNPLEKKMKKAYALVEKEKYEEAGKCVEDILEDDPKYGDGWDYLVKIRYKQYSDSKKMDVLTKGNIVVTTKDENGKEVKAEDDTLGQKLMELLNGISPSEMAYNRFDYTLRKATLVSDEALYCSQVIRNLYIDDEKDTAVGRKALKYFNEAEEEFAKKNYNEAAKYYKKALEEHPDFYKAALYMGDCFYYVGNYIEAIKSFKAAVEKFPNDLEARKYLIDAYAKERLYDNALEEMINSFTVYPDASIEFAKLEDVLDFTDKKLSVHWIPRGTFPGHMPKKVSLNEYKPEKESKLKDPWTFYEEAITKIVPYCDKNGLITKPCDFSQAKYMEVYAWEEMLKNSKDPVLDGARKAQKDGYLDCYALVMCYHYDFYDQYRDFSTKNGARIKEFYRKYIVAK